MTFFQYQVYQFFLQNVISGLLLTDDNSNANKIKQTKTDSVTHHQEEVREIIQWIILFLMNIFSISSLYNSHFKIYKTTDMSSTKNISTKRLKKIIWYTSKFYYLSILLLFISKTIYQKYFYFVIDFDRFCFQKPDHNSTQSRSVTNKNQVRLPYYS